MNKQTLHNQLANIQETVTIPESAFIAVYGDNKTRPMKSYANQEKDRASILAETYNLNVIKEDDNYIFTVK